MLGAAHDERQHERGRGRVLHVDDDQVGATDGVDVLHRVATGDADRGADDGNAVDQGLAQGGFVSRSVPAVVGSDPPVERPRRVERLDAAVLVDAHVPA